MEGLRVAILLLHWYFITARKGVLMLVSLVNQVVSDIEKEDFDSLIIRELEEDAVASVNREAPVVLEYTVKWMCFQARIERIASKHSNPLFCGSLNLRVKVSVVSLKSSAVVDCHSSRRDVSVGSFPARWRRLASRDRWSMSCSRTSAPARAINASSSFLGITTRSSLPASFLGMVIVAITLSISYCFHRAQIDDNFMPSVVN